MPRRRRRAPKPVTAAIRRRRAAPAARQAAGRRSRAAAAAPPRDRSHAQPLLPAPDPALVETRPHGTLPIIGRDGRQPWQVYAPALRPRRQAAAHRHRHHRARPRSAATEAAIERLPARDHARLRPLCQRLWRVDRRARAAGHEVLLGLPMEPVDYPRQDPGPLTLLTSLEPKENVDRLRWC